MRAGARLLVLCSVTVLGAGCSGATDAHPALLTANVVDPQSVNAVSLFNSCEGHSYPQSNSPNSAKNYFWPNSTNFGSNDQLREYAACNGNLVQTNSDTDDPLESVRGRSVHGVSSLAQTVKPGNASCPVFNGNITSADVLLFTPAR